MQELIKKAGILIEALPYIQKFSGKTVVIKYGGNAMINEELKNSVMEDITLLKFIGLNPIVVHGGGPDISKALNERGVKSKFVNGLRVTDDITMQTAQQVLIGKTNKEIVALLNTNGGRAVGISGIDGSFIECKKQYTEVDGEKVDIGYVGDIVHVKHCLIDLLSSDNISLLSLLSVPMRTATAITSMQIRLRRQLRRLLRRKNLFCLLMLRVLRIKTAMLLPKYIKMKYTK